MLNIGRVKKMVAVETSPTTGRVWEIEPGQVNSRYEITHKVKVEWWEEWEELDELTKSRWFRMQFQYKDEENEDEESPPYIIASVSARDLNTAEQKIIRLLISDFELVHLSGSMADSDPVLSRMRRGHRFIKPLYKVSAPSVNGH